MGQLSIEFVEYLLKRKTKPRLHGPYISLSSCLVCPLKVNCLFGSVARHNLKLGHSKLTANMCAYHNGFYLFENVYDD